MAKGFNLTAELNLRGPSNLRTVVSNIKREVGSISANITPTVNRSSIRTIATDIRSQLGNIGVPLNVTVNRTSIQNISRDIRSRLSGIDIPVSVRINRSSLSTARRDINRQLGNINANVNITVSPTAIRNAAGLTRNLTVLNQTLNQTTTSATTAAAAIQSFAAAMRGAAGINIPRNINIGLNTTGTNATNAANSVRELGGEVENFGRQAGLAIRRFAAFTTVTSVFYGLARSIQSGISAFIEFDRELVRISQVTGDNIRDVNKLASTVTNLATTYGVSSKELAGVSLTLAQAGLTAKETERALKALALSALAPSFDDLNSTVEGSIALMRQFGISTNQLEGALGSINSVAAKFAVEASDIIAAIQRTGGVFAAASKGVSEGTDALNEFVAVFTSIRATTRESAETIATGLRTIFTRIQRGPTIEALKQFGVNLTDVEGKFVGAYKAVQLLSEGLTRLDPRDLRFSQIVEELGGFRQIGKVIPLIQEFATAQEALKVAQAGSGSLAEDAAKGQLALAVQISKVREEFLGLIRSVGDTSSFRTLVKLGLDLASSLIQVADAAKELIPLVGIFTAIRGAQALTRFGAGFVGGVRGAPTRGFASGGYVPGVGNSDTVPAMLTPGEFVIRKKAVEKIGVGRLARLNRNNGGPIPTQYFEDGGIVQNRGRASRFARGGRASRRMGVFDFDMTTGITKQKETPSLSGFRSPQLAVPDILAATPTSLVKLMKKYGASQVLTARSGGSRGEMRTALGTFFKKNGVLLPSSRITTLGDQVGSLSTAEKKARALHDMVKKYGGIDFFDDDQANVDAAKMVRGVSAKKVSVMKNFGGYIQKFMAGKAVKPTAQTAKQLRDIKQKIANYALVGPGSSDPLLKDALNKLNKGTSPVEARLRKQIYQMIQSGSLTPDIAKQMLGVGSMQVPTGPGGRKTIQAVSLQTLKKGSETKFTRTIDGEDIDILRASPAQDLSRQMTTALDKGIRVALKGFLKTALTDFAKRNPTRLQELTDLGVKFNSRGQAIPSKEMIDIAMTHGKINELRGNLFERGIMGLGATPGPSLAGKAAPIDAMKVGSIVSDIMSQGQTISPNLPTEIKASTARTRPASGQPDITKGGLVNQILRFQRLQRRASGGEIKGISSSLAREAILGKQLNGVEMIRAARRAGYDIEELDDGMIQLSRNNKAMHTLSRAEASKLLGSMGTGYNLGGSIQKFAKGGSPEDTVPALLTPGEFVINKRAAKRLGSSKLNRLNRADKISGFNSGGSVGNIQSYSSGGDVQRFFFGGGARARPGTEATSQNLMISGNVMNQLREITTALQELGVASSASADLIRRGGRISVQASNAAYEADILRMRVAGAPMQTIIEAETRLANMRQQAQTQIRAQRQLSGVGGAQLENIDTAAQQRLQQLISRRQASGLEVDEAFMRRAEGAAYTRAARQEGLSPTQTAGLTGNDLRQYINSAMGDPRTFEQMNRQFEARRRQEILAQINAERGATTSRREINNRVRESERLAAEETRIRRQTLNQTRGAAGPGGARGERMQQGMFMASFAIPMLAQMIAGDPSKAGSAGGAAMSAGIQGGANAFAMGTMIASMFPPGLGQGLAFAATAAASVGQAFIDARNATIEFEKNLAAKKVEMALEDTGKLFEKLAKDVTDIDVQGAIGQKLIEASVAAQRSIEMQATTAKAFWVNMFDAFGGGSRTERSESAQRSQILERFGTSAYLSTTQTGQYLMGGAGSAQDRANQARNSYISQMIPEQSRELSKQFAPIADNSIKLIEEKIRAGLNIEDYINTDEFKKLSTAIALSNTAVSEQVLRIRNSTVLTDAQKAAQERLIISTAAEEEARRRASIAAREIQLREVQKATNQLSRSLERMFQNMEQAINKTNFGLEKMARDLDLVSSSLTGQAKAGEGAIKAINILQNPRAYGAGEVGAARSQAAGFFAGSSDIVKGLLTLGDDIEATIMGTINRTVKETEGDSPAKIAIAIEKSVKDKLQSLELPPDVSEKLAREVKVALNEIRKEGDQKADFTQIEEKLKDLGRILESTRRAQEVALKVLENWQNSLNNYTSSINSLTDLQIDFAARLRKSAELVIDSQNNLARTLGKDISIETLVGNRNALVRQQTGGVSSPVDIFKNINRLEAQRLQQEGAVDIARQGGPGRLKDFTTMSNNLKLTNVALRENYDALRNLAENSDIAAAALNKIQEAQQRQQGKVGFIEKLVTSTPEEFESLNRAFVRLQNNANGQINTINNSVGAQKAYIEAVQGGATAMEAMRAAQTAFANERRDTLSALNDLLPFLGGGQQANQIRANTLESMLTESGIGVSPMFQEVLNALRNPELDPETQRAIALYQEANQLQIAANAFLNQINNKLQEETAGKAARAIADALANTVLTFKNAEQADLNRGIIPQNRATGGVIYASNGAFAPRGTDTVPAMLTPGEFVVNRNATAKNLPLLKSINSQKFSGGGSVKYYADGGLVSSYLSVKARKREDFQSSKEEFLDPSDTQLTTLFGGAGGAKKLQMLPNVWHRAPTSTTLQAPDKSTDFNNAEKINLDLSKLYPNEGKILPGVVSYALSIAGGSAITPDILAKDTGGVLTASMVPGADNNTIFGIDNDRSVQLKTKQIKKSEFQSYKDNIRKIKNKYDTINWIQNRANPIFRALSNAEEYPNNVTPIQNSAENFNPNSIESNSVLYYGNELNNDEIPYGKIWRWNNPGFGRSYVDTISVGNPVQKPTFGLHSQSDFSEKLPIVSNIPKGIDSSTAGIIKPAETADVIDYHKNQFQLINDAILLADNNFKGLKFIDTKDVGKYQELQTKFSNLYNNLSPYETFNDLGSFHKSFLRNATSLVVASDTASSRNDIAKYVENLQGRLAPGEKPTTQDGKSIIVGLSNNLGGNLNDLTKDWVKKSEFDIFSDKGVGDVKNFPFLVNANIADLGKGFEERAKQALLDQKGMITQETVFDSRKLRLVLDAGKNIDIPYSATYTKYSGPLWDNITKSFSEDPNNQLKNIFLPEDKDIFGGLDISNQRLYNRQPFDISSFASSSIPDGPINQLIDLVKNNGDKNLIDQAKNEIIKNSTLTFPHKGRKVAGSLIKLQNAVGQQIFSGYSQQPSTTFNFGEFLADAVMDYAKQAQQQAGAITGKVADQKLGQEVIGDAPMETVKVLQQLSQGALQVFGRRPVPGLPRGWLFNNIRSLQGILPRGGRTSINRLANNDQAKAAASTIRNVISNAGAYVSNVAGRTNNPQLYNGLKDTYVLMSGAYKAFDSISKSDTRQLAQLLGNNMLVQGQGGGIVENPVENLFRILGASASFQRAAASPLSEDYKAILGNQLVGSKITTVNADGSITRVNPADAPPPKVENYSDLMNLALNPYNEFSSRMVRGGIFDKLIADISTAVDNRGMPYFEPNTSNFLISSLDSLKKWYGGDGAWLGQDYLFDKGANADPANRGQQFLQNLDAGRGLYEMANMAHRNLGGSVKYGDLPGDIWLKNRVEAGNFATGGMVYASGGTLVNFQPRGTDTVPAMLTPGEFVVNRAATQKNLPLLKSINSNTYMADGGLLEQPKVVQGVTIPGRDNLSPRINRIDKNIEINTVNIQAIDKNIASIQDSIEQLSSAQKMLTGSLDSLKDLQNQILLIADMVMKSPEAIYDQVLVTLRQLWNQMGGAIGQTLGNLMNAPWPAAPFNNGGPVYASKGQLINFQPKGTDTVPAMLTPGEFVVNRAATQKNLPLLKSINSGAGGYSRGGVVYLQDGGVASSSFYGVSDRDNELLRKIIPQQPGVEEFTKEDVLRDKNAQQFFQDHLQKLRAAGAVGESYQNWDRRWESEGINYTAALISAGRELVPTIGATLAAAGTYTTIASPGTGPAFPVTAAIGSILAGIGTYMIARGAQGKLVEDNIKTADGTLRNTLDKIAAENPASTALGAGAAGIATGGIPQLGRQALATALAGAGLSTTLTTTRKLLDNDLQYTSADLADILTSAVPGSQIGNISDSIARTASSALAALPIAATFRNSDAAAAILRRQKPSSRSNISAGRISGAMSAAHVGNIGEFTGADLVNLLNNLYASEQGMKSKLIRYLALDVFPSGEPSTLKGAIERISKNKEEANRIASNSQFRTIQAMLIGLPAQANQDLRITGKGVLGSDLQQFFKEASPDQVFGGTRRTSNYVQPIDNNNPASSIQAIIGALDPNRLYKDAEFTSVVQNLIRDGKLSQPKRNATDILFSSPLAETPNAKLTDAQRQRLIDYGIDPENLKSRITGRTRPQGSRTQSRIENIDPRMLMSAPDPQSRMTNLQKMSSAKDVKAFHGTGSGIMSIDPKKLIQGMLGEAFYVGFDAMEAPINYLRMGLDKWLRSNNLKKANVTPEQIAQFQGGIYPVSIRGGIDDFVQADQVLRENPSALAKVQNIYRDLELKRTRLGPIEYVNDPTTGRPKVSRTENPFDLESATMMEAYDNIQNQLAARYETSFAGKANIPDPRGEALALSARDMRTMFVKYGIPGITDLKGAMGQGAMAGIFDESRIALGDAFVPDQVLKEVLGYDDIRDAKRQIEAIRTGKDPAADMLSRFVEMMTNAQTKNRGGIVYASKGQLINFQPKGTDTVPAMLTPGEFVVNRSATQKNLPLLKAINDGVGGYSDGGVVYLQAGGQPQGRPQAGQMPRRGPRDKDEIEAYKRGQLKDRLQGQSANRFEVQKQEAQKNQQGRLWLFTVPDILMEKDAQGKPINNGLQFLLKDANGKPSQELTRESLAAMDISKVFSLRSNSLANAKKEILQIGDKNLNRVQGAIPVDAASAINRTRQQQTRKSFDQKILDELSYQIQTNKNIFSVFNPEFFNTNPAVIDKYTKEMNDVIDNIDLNNPASVMAGMAALGPKVNKVKTRRDYLEEIIRNNAQAVAVLRAANLDPNDPANKREAFGNFLPTQIHDAQIVEGNKELTSAKQILTNLMNNPKVQMGLKNPLVAQAFQRLLMPTGGFGVPISTFEGGAGGVTIPEKLARGGMIYANNGQLINFQSRGSDTVPAMLTPGEFVVNRQSAQNNLPLLQAINSGLYNRGGRVSYLAGGTPGTEALYKSLANFSQILVVGAESVRKVLDTIASRLDESFNGSQNITQTNNGVSNNSNPAAIVDALGNRLDRFIEQLQTALPPFIRVEGQHQVNVVINGGAILQQLLSGPIGNIVQGAIQAAFDKQSRNREGF